MPLFNTGTTAHLADRMPFERGVQELTQFPDGEWRVHITPPAPGTLVWVLASTPAPGDTLIELLLLLDALERAQARIRLMITYLGYARQDRAAAGEALGAQVMCACLNTRNIEAITLVHPHSARLSAFLSFTPLWWYSELCPIAAEYDVLIALDAGAHAFATTLAEQCARRALLLKKERTAGQVAVHFTDDEVHGKRVLIVDDMIATGTSMITAAELLIQAGATAVAGYATHAVLTPGASAALEASRLETLWVTNTLPVTAQGKITVLDCAPWLAASMLHA